MLPIKDSARTRRTPGVNLSLIAINVVLFLYELSLGPHLNAFINRFGVVPVHVVAALQGSPDVSHWVLLTLITGAFLHAGWLHLGGNMLFLWIFGDNVEDRLGHFTYLVFYLACGVVANLAEVSMLPASNIPGLGASGAIAGVLGAYAITYPGAMVSVIIPIFLFFPIIDVPALIMIGIWFLTQFFSGVASLTTAAQGGGGIAWWAHVGGFLFGMLLMVILPKSTMPDPPISDWSISIEERARQDTGLIGLLIGTVSMISQVIQIGIIVRIIIVLLLPPVVVIDHPVRPVVATLLRITGLLVRPFADIFPAFYIHGHVLELYSIAAILTYYLIGVAIIWVIASLAYKPRQRYRQQYPREHA